MQNSPEHHAECILKAAGSSQFDAAAAITYLARLADWAAGEGFCQIEGIEDPEEWVCDMWGQLGPENGDGYSADALGSAILAAVREAMGPGWRPIEEAPFDVMVTLYCPHTDPSVSVGCCAEGSGWLIAEYDMMGSNCRPTHFMPLPSAPEGSE